MENSIDETEEQAGELRDFIAHFQFCDEWLQAANIDDAREQAGEMENESGRGVLWQVVNAEPEHNIGVGDDDYSDGVW